MDILKTLFPFSFKEKNAVADLVVNIIFYGVVGFIAGAAIWLLSKIPIIGVLISILGGAVDLYITIGIVLSVLHYTKVLK